MSYLPPNPEPSEPERVEHLAPQVRQDASDLAESRPAAGTVRNGEAERYAPTWPTNFTKGLPHDRFGVVEQEAFIRFFEALNAAPCSPVADFDVPLGPETVGDDAAEQRKGAHRPDDYQPPAGGEPAVKTFCLRDNKDRMPGVRGWESPRAGHAYDLQGPDAAGLTMPPAPCLGSPELAAEMAEVYALALLRDVPFTEILKGCGVSCDGHKGPTANEVLDALQALDWFNSDVALPGLTPQERRRRRARLNEKSTLTLNELFRGSGPGAKQGPFLSQFLLVGSPSKGSEAENQDTTTQRAAPKTLQQSATSLRNYGPESAPASDGQNDGKDDSKRWSGVRSGLISYGTLGIDQRSTTHTKCLDYMTHWSAWLDVQNGADLRGSDRFTTDSKAKDKSKVAVRFLTTPRDLATYVHFDALYQAYLNACLLMASYEVAPGAGFPSGAFHPTRDSFATFGVPHVLSLVTEVATRALKAVRRQKFQLHLRARPEAVGGVLTLAGTSSADRLESAEADAKATQSALSQFIAWIQDHNAWQNSGTKEQQRAFQVKSGKHCATPPKGWEVCNALLPMAFPEGSPMHGSYGAGHATVAGACITILKAFFELYEDPRKCAKGDATACNPLHTSSEPVNYQDSTWWDPITFDKLATDDDGISAFKRLYEPMTDGSKLVESDFKGRDVTIVGELNKLAANISIARNMAGVHYYTDYYDSLRLGERVAAGILQEQMLTYPDAMSMRFESFDGDQVVFENRPVKHKKSDGRIVHLRSYVHLADEAGEPKGGFSEANFDTWWCRPSEGQETTLGDANADAPCRGPLDGPVPQI